MSEHYIYEPLLDIFAFATSQLLEQLEELILSNEKSSHYSQSAVDEIFRIMHTIKESSAMMMFANISSLTHVIENIFYFIRRDKPDNIDCPPLSDLLLPNFISKFHRIKGFTGCTLPGTGVSALYSISEA